MGMFGKIREAAAAAAEKRAERKAAKAEQKAAKAAAKAERKAAKRKVREPAPEPEPEAAPAPAPREGGAPEESSEGVSAPPEEGKGRTDYPSSLHVSADGEWVISDTVWDGEMSGTLHGKDVRDFLDAWDAGEVATVIYLIADAYGMPDPGMVDPRRSKIRQIDF